MKKVSNFTFLILFLSVSSAFFFNTKKEPQWVSDVGVQVQELEKKFEGEFGVYIKDLTTNSDFSYKASQDWYLSSTVKVPVAIALMKLVDNGELKLTEKVAIQKEDYRDGAGPVNWIVPGQKVSYQYLLDKMLRDSDNAATDLIIKRVGIEAVNKYANEYSDNGFGKITTLLDVRKKAYSEFHPNAEKLSNIAFFRIKKKKAADKKLNQLAKELKLPRKKLKFQDLSEGFDKYYEKGWNTAHLTSYAKLLENLVYGKVLSQSSTRKLMGLLSTIHTGKKRTKQGLPEKVLFAHKTGTQHRQACDMGVASKKSGSKAAVLILVCTKNWDKLSSAEALMSQVGEIVTKAQLL